MYNEVIFDLETKTMFDENGRFEPCNMELSIVSVYIRQLDSQYRETYGEMHSYWENELAGMWKYFQEADRIVGFNSLAFDVPVLAKYAPGQFSKLPHFDILEKIRNLTGHRTSL